MGPTWGPPGSCRPQMGTMLAHEPCYQGSDVVSVGYATWPPVDKWIGWSEYIWGTPHLRWIMCRLQCILCLRDPWEFPPQRPLIILLRSHTGRLMSVVSATVYPKKYAHGFCFAVLCCGYTLTDFPTSIKLTSLALWQSNDCPSVSKATLMNMDKYFMWIRYERLHNHNKAKHNKTVCIFLGIYCR